MVYLNLQNGDGTEHLNCTDPRGLKLEANPGSASLSLYNIPVRYLDAHEETGFTMAMQLVTDNLTLEVEQLSDVPPDWQGLKLMTKRADVNLNLTPGAQVEVKAEASSLAGSYKVDQILSPAAPRGWRLFLVKPGAAKATPQSGSAAMNTDKLFNVEVSGLIGPNVRKSVTTYLIPFSRLSQEVKRITRTGGKIVRITESSPLAPRSQD